MTGDDALADALGWDEDPDHASRPAVVRAHIGYGQEARKLAEQSGGLPERYAPDDESVLARLFGITDDDWSTVG